MEDQIRELLETYDLDDLFDVLDITPERVLEILVEGGHVVLPPWIERSYE